MKNVRLRHLALLIASALLLSACHLDATAPMRTSDIKNTAQTAVPVAVVATLTATFASTSWCQDEGGMVIDALASPDVPIVPLGCSQSDVQQQSTGQYRVTTSLVKTAGARNPETVVHQVLSGDLVRFAVFPHASRDHVLSVGIFLNIAKLEAAKAKLSNLYVFKEGGSGSAKDVSLSISVTNDLSQTQKFYLRNVAADTDGAYAESILELPAGAIETITLDAASRAHLIHDGWVNFFAMDER